MFNQFIPSRGSGIGGHTPPSLFSARGVLEIVRPEASVAVEAAVFMPNCQLSSAAPSSLGLRSIVIAVGTEIPEHQPEHADWAGVASIVVVALPLPHRSRSSSPLSDRWSKARM